MIFQLSVDRARLMLADLACKKFKLCFDFLRHSFACYAGASSIEEESWLYGLAEQYAGLARRRAWMILMSEVRLSPPLIDNFKIFDR